MKLPVVIDRIEEGVAYLQFADGITAMWPVDKLPKGCSEGDVIDVSLEISEEIKEQRNKEIRELQ